MMNGRGRPRSGVIQKQAVIGSVIAIALIAAVVLGGLPALRFLLVSCVKFAFGLFLGFLAIGTVVFFLA